MIKVGDLVYRQRRGGRIKSLPALVTSELGLVIKELPIKAPSEVPQYCVRFNSTDRWFYRYELHKLTEADIPNKTNE